MYNGVIFDMDGTMINNMAFHLKAWETLMAELGHPLRGEPLFRELYGSNRGVLERIFGKARFDDDQVQQLSDRKEALYRELYKPHLQLLPGLTDFLEQLYRQSVLMALGTASNIPNINLTLDTLNIRHFFSAIISADDVQQGKPHPETFLKAAAKMGLSPEECIVFEDVPPGVAAAANAGMKAIVVTTSHQPAEFSAFENVLTFIPDFTHIKFDDIHV
jgi:beta-phosphoglucomutase